MNAKRASVILGVFMAIILIGSTFLQLISGNRATTTQNVVPTATAIPTFPPPPDATAIDFSTLYLHPTNIFAIAQPAGFDQAAPSSSPTIAQVNLVNSSSQSVIDAFVQDPQEPITVEGLSGFFTEQVLASTWSAFTNWSETQRVAGATELQIDFNVTLRGQQFVARQRAWTDGVWVYSVRVLTPENAGEYLRTLLDGVSASLVPFTQFAGTPMNWPAYNDFTTGLVIRHPQNWQVTDGGAGRPTTLTSPDGATLRVETRVGQAVDTQDAATAILQQIRPGATVVTATPVSQEASATQQAANGWEMTYTTVTPDGALQSGLATVLNGPNNAVYVAVLRAPSAVLGSAAEATIEPGSEAAQYEQIMSTFGILPSFNWSATTLPPTATPAATPASIQAPEATAEATAEATVEATAEATTAP
jgi:hypothetical protein